MSLADQRLVARFRGVAVAAARALIGDHDRDPDAHADLALKDSGLRDLSSFIPATTTASHPAITFLGRRVGPIVNYYVFVNDSTSGNFHLIEPATNPIPGFWLPDQEDTGGIKKAFSLCISDSTGLHVGQIYHNTTINGLRVINKGSDPLIGVLSFTTSEDWPTSLPGTAV